MTTDWYGATVAWWAPFEMGARRAFWDLVSIEYGPDRPDRLTYQHAGLEVPGRLEVVPVRIEFYADPPYDCYGLSPWDYPRVFADPGADSPHRMPDDALCLFFPRHPRSRRWTADDGLFSLLNLTRDHLFFELHWRATGRRDWLGPEVPHGFGKGREAA